MKSRFISDPQDPFGEGLLNTGEDAVNTIFFPSSFIPAVGHGGGIPPASVPPVVSATPTPPEEAVQAMAALSSSNGPGSVVSETSGGITINLEFDAAAMAAPQSFRNGIEQAGSILSAAITDKITVNIGIDYSGTGGGAAAGPDNGQYESYSSVRADLVNNATKGDPTFNALPTGSTIQGQSQVAVWNPQLKLWGLLGANDTSTDDGSATFSTDINSNLLVGVALHELTHAVGRVPYGPPYGSQPDIFDLYRFTSPGTQLINGASTAPAAYFSVDGGYTKIADYGQTSDPSDFLNSGVQGSNDPFNEFYTYTTTQGLTTYDLEQLDALGFHLASPLTTTIQTDTNSTASTSLIQSFSNYYLQNASSGLGPELKFGGTPVVAGAGQFSGWAAIGTVQTSTGYDVAWKDAATNQYAVWTTDSSGNFISSTGAIAGTSTTLQTYETTFQQDLNGDGVIGNPITKVVQTDGSTSLVEVGSNYFLDPVGGSSGPELKFGGTPVVPGSGQFSGWAAIGAVQTSTGYDVAWKDAGTNQYAVWTTDSSGNFVSSTGAITPTSSTLETYETTFNQDLNGDGTIGFPPVVIQTDGSTSLVQVGSNYFLDPVGGLSGPELKFGGVAVVPGAGQFSGWAAIGAVQTSSGYDVAWKDAATNQYAVWTTDSSGNFVSSTGAIAANSSTLQTYEITFQQDLNGDGTIGFPVIQTDGSTSLVQVGSNYFLDPVGTLSGPELKFFGVAVVPGAGQFSGWAAIGAEKTSTGYDVAWKDAATNQYAVWTTDSNGNFVSSTGAIAATSTTLQSYESIFQQDLNGDGVIGIYAAPGTTLQINSSLTGPSGSATIGTGATLELAAADSSSVTFSSSTGMLKLDSPSSFNGVIFNFTGNGTLSGSDQIDLKGLNFSSVQDTYANGVLTVTDGTHTDVLDFNGSYTLANFKFASDGSGGTIVYDPPVPAGQVPSTTSAGAAPQAVSVKVESNDTIVFGWGSGAGDFASNPTMMRHVAWIADNHPAALAHDALASLWLTQVSSMTEGPNSFTNPGHHDGPAGANLHVLDLHASHFVFG
jgi:serralysin